MKNCFPERVRDVAGRIVERNLFQKVMSLMILLNITVLVTLSEISRKTDPKSQRTVGALDVLNLIITTFFILELILKWVQDSSEFWKKQANACDFIVTVVSIVPEIFGVFTEKQTHGYLTIVCLLLLLRVVKLLIRIKKLRVTVLIILKNVKGAWATFLFFIIFGYVYAVVGIILLENYSQSDGAKPEFRDTFTNLSKALCTLFIMFTGEDWHGLMRDTWKVPNLQNVLINFYILSWVILGSIMLKMVFMADMVAYFAHSRKEHGKDLEQIEQLNEEQSLSSTQAEQKEKGETGWDACVLQQLQVIHELKVQPTIWNRNLLLNYLGVMEKLQKNMEEWQMICRFEVQSNLNQHMQATDAPTDK